MKAIVRADGTYTVTGGSNRQLTDALLFGPVLSMGRQRLGNLLSEVPAAVRYLEDGRARGKVVITV